MHGKTIYKSHTSPGLSWNCLFSMCQTAGMESKLLDQICGKICFTRTFYFGRNINFNESFFFTEIFSRLSSKLCISEILKINSCLVSRPFHTGKVQTKAKTTERNMRCQWSKSKSLFYNFWGGQLTWKKPKTHLNQNNITLAKI